MAQNFDLLVSELDHLIAVASALRATLNGEPGGITPGDGVNVSAVQVTAKVRQIRDSAANVEAFHRHAANA